MTKKQYSYSSGFFLISFILCDPQLISDLLENKYINQDIDFSLNFVLSLNFFRTFTAIFYLLLAITYHYFNSENKTQKPYVPIIEVLFGSIILLYSIAPPVFSYHWLNKIGVEQFRMPSETLKKLKESATTENCLEECEGKKIVAEIVYNETGENITYINKHQEIAVFSPTLSDLGKRNEEARQEKNRIEKLLILKKIIYLKTAAVILALLLFLVWQNPFKKHKIIEKRLIKS